MGTHCELFFHFVLIARYSLKDNAYIYFSYNKWTNRRKEDKIIEHYSDENIQWIYVIWCMSQKKSLAVNDYYFFNPALIWFWTIVIFMMISFIVL